MNVINSGIALAMSVALEGAESDIERVMVLLQQQHQREDCVKAAAQLFARAKERLQTVRASLMEVGAAALPSSATLMR